MQHCRNPARRQRGASLLLSLVMLVVLTLLVVSAIRMSNTNLKTVSNMQVKNEAIAASQQAIEQVMGSVDNFYTPIQQTIPVDINGDGVADYTVTTALPECINMVPVPGYSLDFAESVPKDTHWDIKATATDTRTGASATLHQGAKVRMDSTATC